jgi:hypothetical protein
MVKNMDAVGLEKSVIFTGAATPEKFIEVSVANYKIDLA